jgi:DNA-binding transcriptional LysR family regulator
MSLQQIKAFYWVVVLGSFAAAADRLCVTQSTISMRVRELEKLLGVELFDRSSRTAQPTATGLELMQYARRMLDMSAEIQEKIMVASAFTGQVRLGVAEVVSLTWLSTLIKAVSASFPKVRLEIEQALTEDLMHSLRRGNVDLIFVPGREPEMGLRTFSLGHVKFSWMASPALKLGGAARTAQDLARQPIIGLARQSFHHLTIEDWFRKEHAYCYYQVRCTSMLVAASMAVNGAGCTFLPERCFQQECTTGKLEKIETSIGSQVGFIAAMSADDADPLVSRIASLACEASDFDS